jgi:hypothetical protein
MLFSPPLPTLSVSLPAPPSTVVLAEVLRMVIGLSPLGAITCRLGILVYWTLMTALRV